MPKRKGPPKPAPSPDASAGRLDDRASAAEAPGGRTVENEEALQGPPPREATILRSDRERQAEEQLAEHAGSGPKLTGGDIDADWSRADSVGEEAVGGTVATPDQDVVDDLGDAWGVSRAPDEEVRTSEEILERRDRNRWQQEP